MARHQNNTLEAVEDSEGVVIRADVSKTSWGREGFEAIRNGVVDSMSFGFRTTRDGEEWRRYVDASGKTVEVRTIKQIAELWDYSPVTFPAYEETSIQSRSKDLAFAHRPKDLGSLPGEEQRAKLAHELELSLESERLEIIEKEMSV
jgi:HK97 family phage prohead protease